MKRICWIWASLLVLGASAVGSQVPPQRFGGQGGAGPTSIDATLEQWRQTYGSRLMTFELLCPNAFGGLTPDNEELYKLHQEFTALRAKANGTVPFAPGETIENVQQRMLEVMKQIQERDKGGGMPAGGPSALQFASPKFLESDHYRAVAAKELQKWCVSRSIFPVSAAYHMRGGEPHAIGAHGFLTFENSKSVDIADLNDGLPWARWRKTATGFQAEVQVDKLVKPPSWPEGADDLTKAAVILQSEARSLQEQACMFLCRTTPKAARRKEVLDGLSGCLKRSLPLDETQAADTQDRPWHLLEALLQWSTVDDLALHLALLHEADRLITFESVSFVSQRKTAGADENAASSAAIMRYLSPVWRDRISMSGWLAGLSQVIKNDAGAKARQLADLDLDAAGTDELVGAYFLLPKAKQVTILQRLRDGKGGDYTTALASLAVGYPEGRDPSASKNPVRPYLDERLQRMNSKTLRTYLASEYGEIRLAALRVAAKKADKTLVPDILPSLWPSGGFSTLVQQQANKTLVALTGAKIGERSRTSETALHDDWEKWWQQSGGRP